MDKERDGICAAGNTMRKGKGWVERNGICAGKESVQEIHRYRGRNTPLSCAGMERDGWKGMGFNREWKGMGCNQEWDSTGNGKGWDATGNGKGWDASGNGKGWDSSRNGKCAGYSPLSWQEYTAAIVRRNTPLSCAGIQRYRAQEIHPYRAQEIHPYRANRMSVLRINGYVVFLHKTISLSSDQGRLVHDIVKNVLSMQRVPETPIHYYDVFLSHRGKDVKNNLASYLYYSLRDHKLQVFFDKEEMQKGRRINSVIEMAINVASIHIVIFSAGYAQSEWCMDELLLMIESGSIIIPVFYNLDPTDMWWNSVDGRNGVYAEALRILEAEKTFDPQTQQDKARYKSSTIEKWKKALMEVTGREGLNLKTYDGDEGKLVDMIVREVIKYTNKGRRGNIFSRTMSEEQSYHSTAM